MGCCVLEILPWGPRDFAMLDYTLTSHGVSLFQCWTMGCCILVAVVDMGCVPVMCWWTAGC